MDTSNTLLETQKEIERIFNKNQLMFRVKSEFKKEPEIKEIMDKFNIPNDFGYDFLAQMALHKRANIQTIVGLLRHHYDNGQMVVNMIVQCIHADLVDWFDDLRVLVTKFELSKDVQEELDKFQFPLPMVVTPKKVQCNKETGYLLSGGSLILKNNYHEDDICLDHINRINRIQLKLNMDTAKMVKNQWKNLDKQKIGETWEDFQKRNRAFDKYNSTTLKVMELIDQASDCFYLTHAYDKRGRTYCRGYHINYQGNEWNKAVIEFKNQEITQ